GVTVLVGLEVRDHMRGRGVARTRPKGHRPTRQGTVSGRGEEFQAVPIMLPGPAGVFIGVEDRETQSPARPVAGGIPVESVQVVPSGEPGLPTADDQNIDAATRSPRCSEAVLVHWFRPDRADRATAGRLRGPRCSVPTGRVVRG